MYAHAFWLTTVTGVNSIFLLEARHTCLSSESVNLVEKAEIHAHTKSCLI